MKQMRLILNLLLVAVVCGCGAETDINDQNQNPSGKTDQGNPEPGLNISPIPIETEPVDTVMMTWLGKASPGWLAYLKMIEYSVRHVKNVVVFVPDSTVKQALVDKLLSWGYFDKSNETDMKLLGDILFFEVPIDSHWIRDYGPFFTKVNGEYRVVDFLYYGGTRPEADQIPSMLADKLGLRTINPPIFMEGGNFLSNGKGLCLTTTWIIEENNTHNEAGKQYTEEDIRKIFKEYLGCTKTVILPRLTYEATGHADMYVMFTGPDSLIVSQYDNEADDTANYPVIQKAIQMITDETGIIPTTVPFAHKYPETDPETVFLSFTNSVILNDTVLMPGFNISSAQDCDTYPASVPDCRALKTFQSLFPSKTIVFVNVAQLARFHGLVHCSMMTVPEGIVDLDKLRPQPAN